MAERSAACSRSTPTPTTSPPRDRPRSPATTTRASTPCSSAARAARRATSSTRPWTARGQGEPGRGTGARSWPTPPSIIGYDEVVMLGYRDSGMPDIEANKNPDCFAMAPLDEAVGRLVAIIRRVRPQVHRHLPRGADPLPAPRPHPGARDQRDRLRRRRRSRRPTPRRGEPYAPAKMYYTVWSVGRMRAIHEKFVELGLESPFSEDRIARMPDRGVVHDDDRRDRLRRRPGRRAAGARHPGRPRARACGSACPPRSKRPCRPPTSTSWPGAGCGSTDVVEDDLFAGVPEAG